MSKRQPNPDATYLGDGLYADHDGHMIRLFTYDGITVKNEVFLEIEVIENFKKFIQQFEKRFALREAVDHDSSDVEPGIV